MRCPCCGANLIYKGKMKVCEYCGYEEKDTSVFKDYNVLVSYPAGTVSYFKIEVKDAGIEFCTRPGESRSLKLVPGPHNVTVSSGNFRRSKVIFVPDNDEVVKIAVWFDGMRDIDIHFEIDQPKVSEQFEPLVNGKLPAQNTVLSKVSLIMACTFMVPIPALVLAYIDRQRASKCNRNVSSSTLCAMILSWIGMVMWLIIFSAALRG